MEGIKLWYNNHMDKDTAEAVSEASKVGGKAIDFLNLIINSVLKLDAKQIKRIGDAEREKKINDAIADQEIKNREIFGNAIARFITKQITEQANLENMLQKAQFLLNGKIAPKQTTDQDFIMKIANVAKGVSRQEVQDLIASILAGEILKPGTYSIRLLDFLKNCSKQDLQKFNNLFAISSPIGLFSMNKINPPFTRYDFADYNVSFLDYNVMTDLGVISSLNTTYYNSSPIMNIEFPDRLMIASKNKSPINDSFSISKFTELGVELYTAMEDQAQNIKSEGYFTDLEQYLKNQEYEVIYKAKKS